MPKTYIDGLSFTHNLTKSELADTKRLITEVRTEAKQCRTRLKQAIAIGDKNEQASAKDCLLYSPRLLFASAISANSKLPPRTRHSLEACMDAACLMDFSNPFGEIVRVHPEAKKSGGVRMIHNHGLWYRTAHNTILWCMSPQFSPRPFQYTNSGVPHAIQHAKTLIHEGYVQYVRLDISNCFPSFSGDALLSVLPLPKEVVEHAVIGRHMKVVMDKTWCHQSDDTYHHMKDLLSLARLGLPQGATCSPIISMFVVAHLAWPPIQDVAMLNYADDFLLLASDSKRLKDAKETLIASVAELPGGQFTLETKQEGSVDQGLKFLGHQLRVRDGKLEVSPTDGNVANLLRKLNPLDTKLGSLMNSSGMQNENKAFDCAVEFYALVTGWKSAFNACDKNAMEWVEIMMQPVKDAAKKLDVSLEQMKNAFQPWMGYKPSGSALEG